jgi:D-xylose transport system ATP-binding protein
LEKLSKSFGPVRALTEVDLALPVGEVTALVGDNGAGKSVTIKTISGLWEPSGGAVGVGGGAGAVAWSAGC